jgi:hypothetical protein
MEDISSRQDTEIRASNCLIPRKSSKQAPHVPDVLEQLFLCKLAQLGALVQSTLFTVDATW